MITKQLPRSMGAMVEADDRLEHLERLLRRASVALQAAGKRTPLVAEIQAACGVHTPRSGLLARLRRAWAALVMVEK